MKVLLAGSTGYLGKYILKALLTKNFNVRAVLRDEKKLSTLVLSDHRLELVKVNLTQPETIINCCQGIDVVISTVGITRQKEGLTYMDVDYQANLNLLEEAKRGGTKKFIYTSVLNGDKLTLLKLCEAKERFVNKLKGSGLDYCIIRPGGYFSDMGEYYEMARKGRIYLFGNGNYLMNPIHGADLAELCVEAVNSRQREISLGGPQTLSHLQLAKIAFSVAGKRVKITHIPDWIRKTILFLLRSFTNSKTYGPLEFFMTVMSMDMTAPEYGTHTLKQYYEELKNKNE